MIFFTQTRNARWLLAGLLAVVCCLYAPRSAVAAPATPEPTAGNVASATEAVPIVKATAEEIAKLEQEKAAKTARNQEIFRSARLGFAGALVGAIMLGIWLSHRGKALPIRDIPGLMVFDEAVSRATEMGRPTLFTCGGACDLKRIQLFGSMPLLREVAKLSGELGNRLIVPVCYPETMPVHMNSMRDGFIDGEALDAYHSDDVRFFPGGQFFFAIAAMGWMLEEKPATCFYFGHWEADSLMFAETGQTINAMQIAGTDQLYQIPFFVASCDYTIIGEEFWAASAKISQDRALLGCLSGQDVLKMLVLLLIVVGTLLCAVPSFNQWMMNVQEVFKGS